MTTMEKAEQICKNPEALKMADALIKNLENDLRFDEITEIVWNRFFA